ncbi:MAG: hypothetical protein WAT74_11375 [Flavobacteriales bacterium]
MKYNAFIVLLFLLSMMTGAHGQDSLARYYHPNGQISSEGGLMDGKPDGWWRNYREDGVIRSEGGRIQGKLDSIWRFYDAKGRLETEISYRNDQKQGLTRQFDTLGMVMSEMPYDSDLREGMAVYYHASGNKHKEVPYRSGREEGKGQEFAEDGRVIAILHYGAGLLRRREEINHIDKRGLKQGPWKEFHSNGKVKWEGGFLDDKRHGIFKEYDALGNLKELIKYDGGVVDTGAAEKLTVEIKRTFHPNGKVSSLGSYSKSGKREGLFKEFDLKGDITGAKIFQGDQLVSEGMVNNVGMLQGPWVEYFSSGEKRAEGSYSDGKKEGEWSFYHRSGKVEQRGKYAAGLPQGQWTWYYESGKMHRQESYRRGKEDGSSVEYAEDGQVITQGEYIDGRREGKWFYEVGDHKEEGTYRDGLKDGLWNYTYGDGKRYFTGAFQNGEPDGKHKWFWPNGRLRMEGKYSGGLAQGEFVHYDEAGNVITVVRYRDGAEIRIDGERVPPPYEPGAFNP